MAALGAAVMNLAPQLNPWPRGEIAVQLDVFAGTRAIVHQDDVSWQMPFEGASSSNGTA